MHRTALLSTGRGFEGADGRRGVLVARIGGLFTSVTASLLLNCYFIPPFYRLTIAAGNNLIALVVLVVVGLTVASVVDLAARQSRRAA
ncbi:K+-sensing histidine kinase KdpD [Catenulispora sp. GP43]|uniref:DUF4118 domain-containing protein n=1 Tax=Catenulispora sp. GP43 TaxID=3156263 RepID=UPI0035180F82